MARSLDIETLIEDAFLTQLPTFVGSTTTVKKWDDIAEKHVTPYVLIKATQVNELEGVMNLYCATNVLVDFAVFTSRKIDEDGTDANALRGYVRNLINQDNIVTLLNAESGLVVYNNGVIPQGSSDVEDDKVFQKMTSVLVVATSTQ